MIVLHVVRSVRPVYVWRTPKEAYNPDCLVPTVKLEGGSVMIGQEYIGILQIL